MNLNYSFDSWLPFTFAYRFELLFTSWHSVSINVYISLTANIFYCLYIPSLFILLFISSHTVYFVIYIFTDNWFIVYIFSDNLFYCLYLHRQFIYCLYLPRQFIHCLYLHRQSFFMAYNLYIFTDNWFYCLYLPTLFILLYIYSHTVYFIA